MKSIRSLLLGSLTALLASCAAPVSMPLHIKKIGIISNVVQAAQPAANVVQQRNWVVRVISSRAGDYMDDETACRLGRSRGVDAVVIVDVTNIGTQTTSNQWMPKELQQISGPYSTCYTANAHARCLDVRSGTMLWSNRTLGNATGPSADVAAANAVNTIFVDILKPFPRRL